MSGPVVHRARRSRRPALIAGALLASLGVAGFLVVRSGQGSPVAATSSAEPVAAAEAGRPVESPRAASAVVAVAAVVPASAPRPAPPWQVSLQPAVVASIRDDALSAYQVQMDSWTCEGEQCVGKLRIPPTVEAGRRGDMGAGANIFDSLKARMAKENVDVALMAIHPSPEGLAIAFQFTPNAALQGRYYTTAEIAAIRLESFEQGRKEREQAGTH